MKWMHLPRRPGLAACFSAVLLGSVLLAGCGADKPDALLASAKDYLAKNDRKAAVIQLKNALQKSPDLGEARLLLGRALLESGEVAAAEKELRKARELKIPTEQVAPPLARAVLLTGEFKKVGDEFGKLELDNPQARAELKTAVGQAYLALGDLDAAKNAIGAALEAQPEYAPALFSRARVLAGEHDLAGALALVESTLAKAGSDVEGWQLKGDLLVALGRPDPALDAYRKALEAKPDSLPVYAQIVSLLLQEGRPDEAKTQLDAAAKLFPKHPQTNYLRALLAYRQKNFNAARDAVQEMLRVAPDNLPGLLLAGSIDYELKAYVQAETSLQKVLQRAPEQILARRLLAGTYLRSGQPAKALETIKPVLDKIEKDSDMLALAGEIYVQNGEAATAASYFEKAAALDPKSPGKRTAMALSHLAQGGDRERAMRELEDVAAVDTGMRADLALIAMRLEQRQTDKALQAISALQKKQPDSPLPHNLRGGALLYKGDTQGARKSFEAALAIDPAFVPAATNLARLDIAAKKPEDARKRFEGVLAKDPKNVQALLALADLRNQAGGTPDEVADLIRKAVAADPSQAAPRLALVANYLRSKDASKALAAAQEAAAALPESPEVLDALGRAQQAAGDSNQAIITYNKLVALQPESPVPMLRLAEIYANTKDPESAKQNLRKALALKPDLIEAQRALMTLELAGGNTGAAVAVAREVQKQRPKQPIGYMLEGDAYASKKSWSEAEAAYRSGLKQTEGTELAAKLNVALVAGGKTAEAEALATSWVRDHPKDLAFRTYLAEQATARKDYATAARHYRTILDAQPNNAVVLNNMAWVSLQLKDPKAPEYAEKAYKAAPEQPAILDTYAMVLVEKGEAARGVELLRKAVGLAPEIPAIRLNLAKGLLRAGDKAGAKKELEVLAKLGDKFPAQEEVTKLMQGL